MANFDSKIEAAIEFLKQKANTLVNLIKKIKFTKKLIAIAVVSAVSVVTVAAVAVSLFSSGSGSSGGGGDNNESDTPRAVAVAFMNACIDKDAVTALSYFPEYKFEGKKDEYIAAYNLYLNEYIAAYETFCELSISVNAVYELHEDQIEELLEWLGAKEYADFDENKIEGYKGVEILLYKNSINDDTVIDEKHEVYLTKYEGKWVIVKTEWPE